VREKEKAGTMLAYLGCGGALAIINERENEKGDLYGCMQM